MNQFPVRKTNGATRGGWQADPKSTFSRKIEIPQGLAALCQDLLISVETIVRIGLTYPFTVQQGCIHGPQFSVSGVLEVAGPAESGGGILNHARRRWRKALFFIVRTPV